LLDDENFIIDSLKRFPKRNEWPGEEYIFPETGKTDFTLRTEFSGKPVNDRVYYYYKNIFEKDRLALKKKKINDHLNKEIDILEKQLLKIDDNISEQKADIYLKNGEILKANLYRIKKGEKKVKVTDYETGSEIEIEVNPLISPSENVKRFFDKYKKMKEGRSKWQEQKKLAEEKLNNYEEIKSYLEGVIDLKEAENAENKIYSGKISRLLKKNASANSIGKQYALANNYRAYVSRNAKEADEMLRKVASGNDYWFHIRDYAGSHIVVKEIKGNEITDEVKIEASTLALYFSKGRNSDEGDIYFTRVKYLHKGKGGAPGLVIPTQEKNVKVLFDKKVLDKIFNRTNKINI
jgi:predicted ribosome quality control (RQC) complex YloA/Tae2 family protein